MKDRNKIRERLEEEQCVRVRRTRARLRTQLLAKKPSSLHHELLFFTELTLWQLLIAGLCTLKGGGVLAAVAAGCAVVYSDAPLCTDVLLRCNQSARKESMSFRALAIFLAGSQPRWLFHAYQSASIPANFTHSCQYSSAQVHRHQRGHGEHKGCAVQLLRRCPRWLGR